MINKNLNINQLAKEFKNKGSVCINDFLDNSYARNLHEFYSEQIPNDWWYLSTIPKTLEILDEADNLKLGGENNISEEISNKKKIADEAFQRGNFSFSFKRTFKEYNYHPEYEKSNESLFIKLLSEPETIKLINQITGSDIKNPHGLFGSLYEEGDFLSIHHDGVIGKIGFVYNLCYEWRPDWGGLLHILNKETTEVVKTYVPGFNTLTLFDSSLKSGAQHFVSRIIKKKVKRISFTGWYE